jgi:hypothetical protein
MDERTNIELIEKNSPNRFEFFRVGLSASRLRSRAGRRESRRRRLPTSSRLDPNSTASSNSRPNSSRLGPDLGLGLLRPFRRRSSRKSGASDKETSD